MYDHSKIEAGFVVATSASSPSVTITGIEDDEEPMDVAVVDVMPMAALVSYEYDYGSTTELFLENLGRHGDLVGLLRPRQPWHGERIMVLARNEPDEECVACANREIAKEHSDSCLAAIADYDQAIALNPDNGTAYSVGGFTKGETGDYSGAIHDSDLAILNGANDGGTYYNRGNAK